MLQFSSPAHAAMDAPVPTPASLGFTPLTPACCSASLAQPLRVLQWNVLADGLAQSGNFSRVSYTTPLLPRSLPTHFILSAALWMLSCLLLPCDLLPCVHVSSELTISILCGDGRSTRSSWSGAIVLLCCSPWFSNTIPMSFACKSSTISVRVAFFTTRPSFMCSPARRSTEMLLLLLMGIASGTRICADLTWCSTMPWRWKWNLRLWNFLKHVTTENRDWYVTWVVRADDYFLPELKRHGYDGEFLQKPGLVSKVHLLSLTLWMLW